jgi:ABC-2 type transport system ATP-binding protein
MRGVVRSLQKTATVLISSHILSEIALTCDRVLIIHKGAIAYEGSEGELGETLGEGVRVTVVVRGRQSAVEEALSASEHVEGYELAEAEDGLVLARVTLAGDTREALVAELVNAGLGVRSMHDAMSQLEEKFLELTRVGGSAEALASRQLGVEKKSEAKAEDRKAEHKEDA